MDFYQNFQPEPAWSAAASASLQPSDGCCDGEITRYSQLTQAEGCHFLYLWKMHECTRLVIIIIFIIKQ